MRLLTQSAALVLVAAVAAAGWEWSPPRQITATPENSILPTVGNGLAGMSGCLHIVYTDKRDNERLLFYLRSYDGGATWLPAVVIEENGSPSVAADSAGNVHLVNLRSGDRRLYYRRSGNQGAVWDSAARMADSSENAVLLTNGQRNVYIFNVVPSIPPHLTMRKSTNGGATWAQAVRVLQTTGFNGLTGCASGSGTINFFYGYGPLQATQLYQVRSTDDGATWSPETRLPSQPNCAPKDCWSFGELVFLTTAG